MADAQIRQLLLSRNAWWRDAEAWKRDDLHLHEAAAAPFDYAPDPLAGVGPPGLYILAGPRRVGKSLELRRAIARLLSEGVDPMQVVYCSCDGLGPQDLRSAFTVGRSLTRQADGPRYWFVDEVTAVRGWSAIVKDLRDDTPLRDDCVIVCASSARDLSAAAKDLAGRRGGVRDGDRMLLPMGFRAFCAAIGVVGIPAIDPFRPRDLQGAAAQRAFDRLEPWSGELTQAWESYVRVGGYPRAVRDFVVHGDVQGDFLDDVWNAVRGDALGATSLSDAGVLRLLARLGDGVGTPLNASRVAREVGLGNHHRVNDRVDDLVFAFLAWRVYQNAGGKPSLRAFRKVYLTDPLVARVASHVDERYAPLDDLPLSEQQLGFALARAVESQRSGGSAGADGVLYERTPTETEIDFVGFELDVPFDSKYVDANWKREAQTVGAAYGRGIVATRSVYDTSGRVWAVPVALLAWLLAG